MVESLVLDESINSRQWVEWWRLRSDDDNVSGTIVAGSNSSFQYRPLRRHSPESEIALRSFQTNAGPVNSSVRFKQKIEAAARKEHVFCSSETIRAAKKKKFSFGQTMLPVTIFNASWAETIVHD